MAALTKETFLRVFVSALVRTDAAHLSRQECFVLQRWSSLALQAIRLPAGLKAAQKLMERQVIPGVGLVESNSVPAHVAPLQVAQQ